MERRVFLRQGGMACLSALVLPGVLSGCAASAHITGTLAGDDLVVPLSAFADPSHPGEFRPFVVVHQSSVRYPVAVFRTATGEFSALLMRCTHQGAELKATGNELYCPSHGSTFSDAGAVVKGPAAEALRTMPVHTEGTELHISLRKA